MEAEPYNPFDTQPPQPSEPGSPMITTDYPSPTQSTGRPFGRSSTATAPPAPIAPPTIQPIAPPAPAPLPANPGVAMVDPTMINMTPDQSVESRSAGIIAKNSPLMQLAETRANQQANARGLINSSMAVGAGQTAVLDKATDIAKSDASTAAQTAQLNANASNTAKSLNAAATNQFSMVDKTTQADIAKMGVAQTFDLAKMDVTAANTLKQMGAEQQNNLAKMAAAQGYDLSKMTAQQVNDLAKMNAMQGFDLAKMDRQSALTISQMSEQQKNDLIQLASKQGYQLQTMGTQQVNDLAKLTVQIEAQDRQAEQKFGFDRQLVEIQKASNREIASLEAQYKNLTQASASATSIINSVSSNVARIMENTTLDATAKQKAIDTYSANANKALQMIGAISGDVDLLSFFDDVLAEEPVPA